jgi:hypothetical protein
MNYKELISKWAWQILAVLFFLLYLGKGCTSSKVSKTNLILEEKTDRLEAKIDSLSNIISDLNDKTSSKKEIRDVLELVMLDYLIYEDDLDNGKISLSKIKDKIKSND